MALRSVRDLVLAADAGRVHSQRFFKNAGATGDGQWQDWSFSSGQPAYDARIGGALAFTPFVAARNDAIFYPGIPDGMERRITGVDVATIPGGTGQTNVEFSLYDLIGVYPLIDGDSTDLQEMDNTATLPRYADGAGVFPVLVNHVAPVLSAANVAVEYVNSDGVTRSVTWAATANGQNKVCYTTATGGTSGPLYCALAGGDRGVRAISSIQFATAPGGLWAIYLCRPLASFANRGGQPAVTVTATAERSFALQNGFNMPLVPDGAWLGFFYMPNGSARTVAMHGQMHFAWG